MADLLSSMDGTSATAIRGLLTVCFPDARTTLDTTYGNGNFWGEAQPTIGGDILPARARDCVLDYRRLPFRDQSVDVVIFDPPFQPATTRQQAGKTERRFMHGARGIGAVKADVELGCVEAFRVGRLGCIVKVQDYIHSHRPIWMTKWVWDVLGEPYDFLTLRVPSKLRASNWKEQRSVWRNHSTFWVFRHRSIR